MTPRNPRGRLLASGCVILMLATLVGCRLTPDYVELRKVPRNPLEGPLQLLSRSGPKPTDRTERVLERLDVDTESHEKRPGDSEFLRLQQSFELVPTLETMHALAELGYIEGVRAERRGNDAEALDRYSAAVGYAYFYLFDPGFEHERNAYDPQFRRSCDLYNASLEAALRLLHEDGRLLPGTQLSVRTGRQQFQVAVTLQGPWHPEDLERFEFASDYEIRGLTNRHHGYGLGVPLIAVRRDHANESPDEAHYPEGLSFPVTAFLRVLNPAVPGSDQICHCVLELVDPLAHPHVPLDGRTVPLEYDATTPLAYTLEQQEAKRSFLDVATLGLLKPDSTSDLQGLYMVEPFDPGRIPVLMVHGLWSSPVTWMEMFNELRTYPEIRERYQFWFYLYPTGQPFWVSAAQMRDDLEQTRRDLDPYRQFAALDQMVLVGHSMGGLVSRLQTLYSGDDFWGMVSHQPFSELEAESEVREEIARVVFFEPNPSVRRVITIGTPHQGSRYINDTTRYLARQVIRIPSRLMRTGGAAVRNNPDLFHDTELLTISNSIDSLAPESPILPVMHQAQRASWVRYHNIVGELPRDNWLSRLTRKGDGVVSLDSARSPDVESEVRVPADHMTVHHHPRAILEVRRILLEHARQAEGPVVHAAAVPWALPAPQQR